MQRHPSVFWREYPGHMTSDCCAMDTIQLEDNNANNLAASHGKMWNCFGGKYLQFLGTIYHFDGYFGLFVTKKF